MKLRQFLSKLKKRISDSHFFAVLLAVVIYTVLCFIYWYVEIGPGGKKTFWDILLWNNLNVLMSRGYTEYIPTSWQGRALLMIFILCSMLFLSTIIGFVSSKINAYNNSPARRVKKVQAL